MTMAEIKNLTDWMKTLESRTVAARTVTGHTHRIIGIGRKWVRCLGCQLLPEEIVAIVGLPGGDIPPAPGPVPSDVSL